jgi:hypothetical protein
VFVGVLLGVFVGVIVGVLVGVVGVHATTPVQLAPLPSKWSTPAQPIPAHNPSHDGPPVPVSTQMVPVHGGVQTQHPAAQTGEGESHPTANTSPRTQATTRAAIPTMWWPYY